MPKYRIGIDVGGTFTHAVALEIPELGLAAQAKVPTTYRGEGGVAKDVVKALHLLLSKSGIAPEDISFLAYSTTLVTNALLEGDVARVGIIAIGSGLEGKRAQKETRVGDLELAPGKWLRTSHIFLDRDQLEETTLRAELMQMQEAGVKAVVAAEAFSVDDPSREQLVATVAREMRLPATGTHEISGRYGLRVRTRTAVINASLLPKAVETADMTERAVRESGITAPLMVVRSDGGVMSVDEIRRRPVLTLLSGPAAGVAAALMYLRVSDGIFLEVGGTSTDISAIQHGRALLRTAEVGGHRLFLRTLDVRTIGVAGGSMPRLRANALQDVGPRSAHIAGLPYSCFEQPEALRAEGNDSKAVLLSPLPGDPQDYVAIQVSPEKHIALTVTCAANAAGEVSEGDFAGGNIESARIAFAALGKELGHTSEAAAASVLIMSAEKAARTVKALLSDRKMSPETTELVGGGGGAGALVPAVGKHLHLPVRLAPNSPVVSAIGTALAVVRDVIERTVPEASETQVLQIRREAVEAAVAAGADPVSVTVDIEYDPQTAVLRAIATGQTELRERDLAQALASDEERQTAAAKSLRIAADQLEIIADNGLLRAYRGTRESRCGFGLLKQRQVLLALVDRQGVVRLLLQGGVARASEASRARETLSALLHDHIRYGDAGAELPQLFLGVRGKIVNLSGLINTAQVLSLAEAEVSGLTADEMVMIALAQR